MNGLARLLVLSRFARQKQKLFLLFLAIAAASCLVVWIVGGYQNLFSEIIRTNNRPFGKYDLKLGSETPRGPGMGRRGGPAFGGPLAKRGTPGEMTGTPEKRMGGGFGGPRPEKNDEEKAPRFDPLQPARSRDGSIILDQIPERIPGHIRTRLINADTDGDGVVSRVEEEALYDDPFGRGEEETGEKETASNSSGEASSGKPQRRGGQGARHAAIPDSLIADLMHDPAVRSLDRMRTVRGFIFVLTGETKQTEETENTEISGKETAPEGIDPELHRQGLAAYRARMGLPMGLGETFTGTGAAEPPADLEEGRWFSAPSAREAVLTASAAKRFGAKPGDLVLILTKTNEFQLKVSGILDDKSAGFYVPLETADEIAGTPREINEVGIALVHPETESEFKEHWEKRTAKEAPETVLLTKADYIKKQEEQIQAVSTFRSQAIAGTILAILASMMIILTALTIGVEERRREIGLIRAVGVGRIQIALSILTESLLLAIPGWLGGLLAGWLILRLMSGKEFGLNSAMTGFSFLCAVIGSVLAAVVPILNACRVRPLEAVSDAREIPAQHGTHRERNLKKLVLPLLGFTLIAGDLFLIYGVHTDQTKRAALHSGLGILALALGVLCLIPTLVRLAERVLLPVLAVLFRFDRTVSSTELSRHIRRTSSAAAMMAVGGGLFVMMQIWGYSMLEPFLPNTQMPDAFAAFLPNGLTEDAVVEVREIPHIKAGEFEPVAVEQAAFAPESIPNGRGGEFANVVFFGMDVDRAFAGAKPLVRLRFLEGDPVSAFKAMKEERGVVVNDALKIDYGFKLGDTLRLSDPKRNARVLEYKIVGIVSFNGWQWLSKTGGVRRNYGRSGGVVFTSAELVRSDYHLTDTGYFWFNLDKDADYAKLETALDAIAQKHRKHTEGEERAGAKRGNREQNAGNAAYVKLSTRESLRESISKRADGVIWGLSTMPLVTLALMSIALGAVTVHSVQTRRRTFEILRAVGIERSKLMRMILTESLLLASVAAAASLLFGIPAAAGALKLGQSMFGTADPALILPSKGLSAGLGFLVLLAILAAAVPALRIGREK